MHIMTGNLSYQIEHHLFPDLPSNRYQEIAPRVEDLFRRYGLRYTTGPLPKQVGSAWAKIIRLSFPNGFFEGAPSGRGVSLLRRGNRSSRRAVTKAA
jgi:linoleoyl-CoA desaturase